MYQFLGQTNVRTLKLLVPARNAQLRVTPFHPKNPVAFANAKRQAESSLIKPQIKVFSHQSVNNRTVTANQFSSSTQTSAFSNVRLWI